MCSAAWSDFFFGAGHTPSMPHALRLIHALLAALLCCTGNAATAQDYEREARWAKETLATLMVGRAVQLEQKSGHRFLGLYTPAQAPRGAVVIAHGRGWGPDFELYGALRTQLAEAGYSTLSIQLPVLPGTAKIGDYLPLFPDSNERFAVAVAWLRAQGNTRVAIVSHSLGATMANQYLITVPNPDVDAWVFISIVNGLEDMFRIKVPVLDVFGTLDWQVTRYGAEERRAQILKIAGSEQVIVQGAEHFFDRQQEELAGVIGAFLGRVLK
jgi:pimeloyl-ACP methyl ester carboxylesterase